MGDFISQFLTTTEELFSPEAFRKWAAIATVAGVLERRVYSPARATRPTYPNLYTCLIGISGSGKTEAINVARALWARLDEFFLAPDNLTNAAFYDSLEASLKTRMNGGSLDVYSAMTVCNRELGVLFPDYDRGWLSDLSDLWDNPDTWKSARRSSKNAAGRLLTDIERPTVNILCGATPKFLSDVMPEIAWGQGFAARMLYIFGHREMNSNNNGTTPPIDPLKPISKTDLAQLHSMLRSIYLLEGECSWSPPAHTEIIAWFAAGEPPVPQHARLTEYRTRRLQHAIKLSMISAASSGHGLYIHLDDFERALEWLTEAEEQMPNVFSAMTSKSDSQILSALHYHFWTKHASVLLKDRKPITQQELWNWLRERVEAPRIPSILTAAEKSGIMKKGLPDEWWPQPYDQQM